MISGINHITLSSKNLNESFIFYKDVLKFIPLVKWERGAYFLAGELWFCISLDQTFKSSKQKGHVAFSATKIFINEIKEKIEKRLIKEWRINSSEGDSVYILDPSGNQLELHIGTWETRLKSIKQQPYKGSIEFY